MEIIMRETKGTLGRKCAFIFCLPLLLIRYSPGTNLPVFVVVIFVVFVTLVILVLIVATVATVAAVDVAAQRKQSGAEGGFHFVIRRSPRGNDGPCTPGVARGRGGCLVQQARS
ncbi:hypothetical protein PMIN06_013007 [Paraphaeosphaeria minitans]